MLGAQIGLAGIGALLETLVGTLAVALVTVAAGTAALPFPARRCGLLAAAKAAFAHSHVSSSNSAKIGRPYFILLIRVDSGPCEKSREF
jgi:hypothetical protein